ncbi:MAG: transposase [Pseudomonadota bacterium]|nr:transposase [Pseudomonadota bacterium]MDP2353696.1 transposase [Pseudomonadota bacterium]
MVFTLPHAINAVAPTSAVDRLLFACASQTLLDFARDPKWLGAEPAITMILHTWDQRLMAHRHVHCLVSGGGLNPEGEWVNAKPHFLFPVRALSRVFRGKYIAALAAGLDQGELRLPAEVRRDALLAELTHQDWVVYAKPPFAGPQQVLAYLGRYTHRTAIGNQRLVSLESGVVRFRWRDRAHGNAVRVMALPAKAFIHRFLLHVLPKGFQRIRHYGLLANRHKTASLARARAALNLPPAEPVAKESVEDFARRVLGLDLQRCPVCGEGRLRLVATLPRQRGPPEHA